MLMTGLVVVIATVAVATTGLGLAYAARAQAQTASDAAALAAAVATYPPAAQTGPTTVASQISARNGALLVGCDCPVDLTMRPRVVNVATEVVVDIPLFGVVAVRAESRAEFDPRRWLGR